LIEENTSVVMSMRVLASVALLLAVTAGPRAQEFDLDVLLDRLATYLEKYETDLNTLIADERYVQQELVERGRGQGRLAMPRRTQRTTDA
jgi:hypothetical protein